MKKIKGVIFDLDGVICPTDEYHFEAWKRIADEEGIPFSREDNELLRGVSRKDSLEIILKKATRVYSEEEKESLLAKKNELYRSSLALLSPFDVKEDTLHAMREMREKGILLAIGSSSKNAPYILERIGLSSFFDAVVDGSMISHSKPDPEVFLLAASLLKLLPNECIVVEDALAGIEAASRGGFIPAGILGASFSPLAQIRIKKISDLLQYIQKR